jgi:glycine/D-amino acid oxidase-like deaminating enzyme/nitrite reductase/ring-hydroxylating ferredoxin subunit
MIPPAGTTARAPTGAPAAAAAHEASLPLWLDEAHEEFPPLAGACAVDVAIVGGGIVGLTAAALLKRCGQRVAVIEARRIGHGVTGHSTAKITSLHRLIYADLVRRHGEERARLYGAANQAGLEWIARSVIEADIDCQLERASAYTYCETPRQRRQLEAEVETASRLGLPAGFVEHTELPFAVGGAVRFADQAQFHPYRYLLGLARLVPGAGSYLFEQTRVLDVRDGRPCAVITDRGELRARDVIVATNLPILDRGLYFARTSPRRSYVIAAPVARDRAPTGMYINTEEPYRSIRTVRLRGETLLLIGGEQHRTGTVSATAARYEPLEAFARHHFGISSVRYRWSTQDFVSADQVPYAGPLTPRTRHVYVATGFGGWGISNGTASAMLLTDLILGHQSPWSAVYDPGRVRSFFVPRALAANLHVAAHWLKSRLPPGRPVSLAQIAPGTARVMTIDRHKVGVHRDEQGRLHAVAASCSHMGCSLRWNDSERSWDCPCHGSRFDHQGKVLHGPAVRDLQRYPLSGE